MRFARLFRPTYAGANMGHPSVLFGPKDPVLTQNGFLFAFTPTLVSGAVRSFNP
jgi:hypothetical protein